MLKKFLFCFICFFAALIAAAQEPSGSRSTDGPANLRSQTIEMLHQTQGEVGNLRSVENRISFSSELASLTWPYDEKEATAMYQAVSQELGRLLVAYDARMNGFAGAEDDSDYELGSLFSEPSDKGRILQKFRVALSIRQQIALSLAEHAPDLALAFYSDSIAVLTNPALIQRAKESNSSFEYQLMTKIAASNAAKATEFGLRSLDDGVNYQHIALLKTIYEKDQSKGIDFASAIVSRLKAEKKTEMASQIWLFSSLIKYGEETAQKIKGKSEAKPVFSDQNLRDLAETMAQAILAADSFDYMDDGYMETIKKYAPALAGQIRSKFQKDRRNASAADGTETPDSKVGMTLTASDETEAIAARRLKAVSERDAAAKQLSEDVKTLGKDKLSDEERQKIIARAREIISKTRGTGDKVMALSQLAVQVAKAGDNYIAAQIMREAENLVDPDPQNYRDYTMRWLLISGYAEVNPSRAFSILDDTIYRLNGTIRGFVTAAEFIDVGGDFISDGEVQVGQFGGATILRGITKDLGIAAPTLRQLAMADLGKLNATANGIERPEVRILAKMIILQSIAKEDAPAAADEKKEDQQ